MIELIYSTVLQLNNFDDLYNVPRDILLNHTIKEEYYNNINIGLLNVPCGGFGDIIACKTIYDYLTQWYPKANTYICTTEKIKFKSLNVSIKNMINLINNKNIDCPSFKDLKLSRNIKFDIMIVVPVINRTFYIEELTPMIPYATYFNTYTISEYNGLFPPYTMPIGVGGDNLGLLLTNMEVKKTNLISGKYALIYIQPSPIIGVHGNHCFLSFLEMITKKYNYNNFQVIIPEWIVELIKCYVIDPQAGTCYNIYRYLRTHLNKYKNVVLIDGDKNKYIINKSDDKDSKELILRGDILPQPRENFVSLIKYSVPDVLLTGDQSITDALSCCKNKIIWYQIAPWKQRFAVSLSENIPNMYLRTFKT